MEQQPTTRSCSMAQSMLGNGLILRLVPFRKFTSNYITTTVPLGVDHVFEFTNSIYNSYTNLKVGTNSGNDGTLSVLTITDDNHLP